MDKPLVIAVLFGGQSAEHDISLISAENIIKQIPKDQYDVIPVAVDRDGGWWTHTDFTKLVEKSRKVPQLELSQARPICLVPGQKNPVCYKDSSEAIPIDAIFSILHGPIGEDGSMQGLFRILGLPFVGPGLLASAMGMDKDIMKRLIRAAGLLTSDWLVMHAHAKNQYDADKIIEVLGLPLFVKPANMGSSIGISKVHTADQLKPAIDEAFLYDNKIILEKNIQGREIEIAVLGNEQPIASVAGEIIPVKDWYSYESKYFDENGAILKIPAEMSETTLHKVQEVALLAYQTLGLEGLSRVDMFITPHDLIYFNEVNTLPGFTSISMYPKLLEHSGIAPGDLMHQLIQLALNRFEKTSQLKKNKEAP